MAYKHELVENKIAVRYHGVIVYHTHKEDDCFNSTNDYIFTTDPFGSENDIEEDEDSGTFDVRNLDGYNSEMSVEQNLLHAIDAGLFGETNTNMREGGMIETFNVDQSADESRCPVCQSVLVDSGNDSVWGSSGLTDDGSHYEYKCQCPQCKATFKQVYRLEFEGYDID